MFERSCNSLPGLSKLEPARPLTCDVLVCVEVPGGQEAAAGPYRAASKPRARAPPPSGARRSDEMDTAGLGTCV